VKEIECALGVSRSSVSLWVRNIQLDDEHRRRLVANVTEGKLRPAERKARPLLGTKAARGETRY
jgi:hypothetical protein